MGGLRARRKVGFIFIEPYVFLPQWLDPLGPLWTPSRKMYMLAMDTAGVKGEAIYINYWRAVNIIS